MKLVVLTLLTLLGCCALAAAPDIPPGHANSLADALAPRTAASWSVAGQWQCTHPAWTDTITISSDGTFSRAQGDAGRWTLTGWQDHVALILAWKDWPASTLALITPDDFRSKVRGREGNGEFTMRRIPAGTSESRTVALSNSQPRLLGVLGGNDPAQPPAVSIEIRHWHQGNPPLRLIRKEEGFCALLSVGGHFQGGGEQVRLSIGEDGYWYLGGRSMQQAVDAECIVVRLPTTAFPASAAPSPAPAESVHILAASYSFGSQYADVTERVKELLRGGGAFQANPQWLLSDPKPGWNKALVIFCEVRGKRSIFSVGEGESISRELLLEKARPVSGKASPQKSAYRVDTRLSDPPNPENIRRAGVFSNPGGDCSLVQTDREIAVTVPGGAVHDLFPVNSTVNAPTVLSPVEGDFMAQVKVSGNFDPGTEPAKDFPRAFHGAGLLVFQDKDNFVRLERGEMMWKNSSSHTYWHPLFQQYIDGLYQEFLGPPNMLKPIFTEAATDLRLVRKGGVIEGFVSRDDGKTWNALGHFESLKGKEVQVGVSALNTSAQEFKAVFEGLTITPLTASEE